MKRKPTVAKTAVEYCYRCCLNTTHRISADVYDPSTKYIICEECNNLTATRIGYDQ